MSILVLKIHWGPPRVFMFFYLDLNLDISFYYRNGASAVELDLDFTEDNQAVIIHDDTVDRTTNGSGLVKQMKLEQIRQLNAAHHAKKVFYEDGTNTQVGFEPVPTLREAVEFCMELGVKIILDVKSNPKLVGLCVFIFILPFHTKFDI